MRDSQLAPVAVIEHRGRITTNDQLWAMEEVVGSPGSQYLFETAFVPYSAYVRDTIDKIDLVVSVDGEHLRPLEIKLTVVPDITTATLSEDRWSPEMVLRPVSSAYSMMSVAATLATDQATREQVLASLRVGYNLIGDWDNSTEIAQHAEPLRSVLDETLQIIADQGFQRPFLIQPLWRTVGQSFELAENCFDVFVWSDVAVMRIPADQAQNATVVSRPMREVARHIKALYEVLSQGDYHYTGIYKGMALGHQTDKSFALSGQKSIRYLKNKHLSRPRLHRSVLANLVTGGGENRLKPERRFDAAFVAYMLQHRKQP